MVDRSSPVPIYYQLKLHFKQQMEASILRPGDRLPTEMELCELFWLGSMESAVHAWNQHHPDQEVKLKVTMCSRDDFHRQLRRTVAQGEAPDIVPMDYVWIRDYARAGYIAPLNKLDKQWAQELTDSLEPPAALNNTVDG